MDSIYIIKLSALELQFSLITCTSALTLTSVLVWNSCTHLLHRMDQFIQTWHKVFLHCTRRGFIWIFNNFKEMANLLKGEIVMVKRGCFGISLLQDPLHKECQKKSSRRSHNLWKRFWIVKIVKSMIPRPLYWAPGAVQSSA